jgi:D-alanyl-D-alanine carboxypeptidase (penicillin-binding protein 5/6)
LHKETLSQNQLPNAQYFLRLGATLLIVAIVWLGANFFKNEPPNNPAEKSKNNAVSEQKTNRLAASLPIAQEAFLVPVGDLAVPIRKWNIKEPPFTAQSIYAFETNSGKILLAKEPNQQRQIASLSKLMTALIIIEKAGLKDEIVVSKNAVDTPGEMGSLVANESLSVESLLYALLVESSNDAAVALAEKFDGQFISFMNQKAEFFDLKNTRFSDPSGLSIENVSTAYDVARIMQEAIKYPLLNYIMKTPQAEIVSLDGKYKHKLTNSNKLLAKYPEIIAGKTGYLNEAGSCMALAIKPPSGQGIIINVILGSQDRIGEMDKLIQWEKEAFIW